MRTVQMCIYIYAYLRTRTSFCSLKDGIPAYDVFFTIIFFGVHIVCMCVRACKNATVLEIKGGIEVIFSCAKFGRYLSIYIIFMFKIFLLNSRLQIFSEVVADGTLVGC